MKKNIKIFIILAILVLSCSIVVFASSAIAELSLSKEQVIKGEEFTVTLSASCEDGLNGIEGILTYDESKLEVVKTEIVDTTKWSNLGDTTNFAILHLSNDTIKTANILQITFKVKDTVDIGAKAKITMSNIKVDSDAGTNSQVEIENKEVEVTVIEEQIIPEPSSEKTLTSIVIEKAPTKTTYITGDKFDITGMKVIAKYSDGSSEEITKYTIEDGIVLEEGQEYVTIIYSEGIKIVSAKQNITVNKVKSNSSESSNNNINDSTKAESKIPYTGSTSTIIFIAIIGVLSVVFYIKYNKYKQI